MASKAKQRISARKTIRVLIACVGRRVELVQAFRDAARRLRQKIVVYGTDISSLAPAMHLVDQGMQLPPIGNRQYIPALLEIIQEERIQLVVPTIDHDLLKLSRAREKIEALGCKVLVSPPKTIKMCQDKVAAFQALTEAGLPTPQTWTYEEFKKQRKSRYPYFLKPRFGSAGLGTRKIESRAELDVLAPKVPHPLVQVFADGVEHTLDVYLGLTGQVRCVVPRRRINVRWGEVAKGQVVKNAEIMELGRRVAEAIPEPIGVWTVQIIRDNKGRMNVIEINPRFGGGAPLAIAAGAHFPKWLLMELQGQRPRIRFDGFTDRMYMLRYDQSVFGVGLDDRP